MKLRLIILALSLLILSQTPVAAYDFVSVNSDGVEMYYNAINDTEAEVTYAQHFNSTQSYQGIVDIPEYVVYEDKTYQVVAVGDWAFYNCRDLEGVNLPSSLKSLGMWSFAWCDALSEIVLPKSLVEIGANAWDGCFGLSTIKVENGNNAYTSIDGKLYSEDLNVIVSLPPACEGTYEIAAGTDAIGKGAFACCPFVTDVVIPEGIKTIADDAFYFCNQLSRISVPASVESIGNAAFIDCFNLKEIKVDAANANYASVDGVLCDKDTLQVIQSPGAKQGLAIIPKTAEEIGELAFFRNYSLTTVKTPASLKSIGEGAFIDCNGITTVELGESVKKIGSMAFALCENLEGIYVSAPDPKDIILGDEVFVGVNDTICTLFVSKGSQSLYANAPQWSSFRNIIETQGLKPQSIEWDVDSLVDADSTQISLTASASSGLPVSYRIAPQSVGIAYILDEVAVVEVKGEITVTAYQNGNEEYLPAEPLTYTFFASQSGVSDPIVDLSHIKVYGGVGRVIIRGAQDSDAVDVYDMRGVSIYHGLNHEIPVASNNLYVVKVGNQVFKVAVK